MRIITINIMMVVYVATVFNLVDCESAESSGTPKVVFATADNTTKAKIFLGAGDDIVTVSNSGMIVYGQAGNDAVTISSGVTDVTLDQNIEQINLSAASSNYTFKQTGNLINVYDATGTTLIVKAPVQGDSDGTLLSFSDGIASTSLTGGVMTLGGVTVSSGSLPTSLTPNLLPSTPVNSAPIVTGKWSGNFKSGSGVVGSSVSTISLEQNGTTLTGYYSDAGGTAGSISGTEMATRLLIQCI